ncbi:MAG: ethylbenzene dehydrogenase-related protein [Candidatus Hydrothermarchaeaceae archaeon]
MSARTCISISIVLLTIPSLIYASVAPGTVLTAERTREEIQIDGYPNEKAWEGANELIIRVQDGSIGAIDVSLRALYDSNYIYFLSSWPDPTESVSKDMWIFDGENWTASGNEDRIAFYWNIDDSIAGFNIGGCAMLCHGDRMHTNAPEEIGDLWHWKASRTNPLGYTDDEWIDNHVLGEYTEEAKEVAMHGDGAYSIYKEDYVKNVNSDGTGPKYYEPSPEDELDERFIYWDEVENGDAIEIKDLTNFSVGYSVPGYLLKKPIENMDDIDSNGVWRDERWMVELRRKLNTGYESDVQFDVTRTYRFGVAIMDNTGGFEAYGKGHSFALGAKTLEFGGLGSEEVTQLSLIRDYLLTAKTHVERGNKGLAISETNNALALYNEIGDAIATKDPELYLKSKKSFVQSKRDPSVVNLRELIDDIDTIMLTFQGKRTPPEVPWRLKLLVFWGRIQLYAFIFLAVLVTYPIYKTLKVGARPQLRYLSLFLLLVITPILFEGLGRLGILLRIQPLQNLSFTTNEYITLLWTIGMFVALLIARYAFLEIDNTIGELEHKSRELENHVKKIQTLKDFNENIINNAPVGVLTTDASGMITSVNPRCLKMLVLENKETGIGQNITDLFLVKRLGWDKQIKQALKGKPFVLIDEKYSVAPNNVVHASVHCTPLYDEMKSSDGLLLLIQDNTDRKLMEEKFSQTEKLAATGKLAATIAHEINNPLTGVMNCIHLVMDETGRRNPNRKYLEMADEELNRISRIVRRLLDSYRPSMDQMAPISVNEILEEVLELMKTQLISNKISVRRDLYPHLPKVMASPEQLKEVFLNILINAQEAMPNEGSIFVETDVDEQDIKIKIRDTGIGIPEENINKIFDPFYTTKRDGKGTGLGLSVSYGIIQAHKGTISASSKENDGITITVTLPIHKEGKKDD